MMRRWLGVVAVAGAVMAGGNAFALPLETPSVPMAAAFELRDQSLSPLPSPPPQAGEGTKGKYPQAGEGTKGEYPQAGEGMKEEYPQAGEGEGMAKRKEYPSSRLEGEAAQRNPSSRLEGGMHKEYPSSRLRGEVRWGASCTHCLYHAPTSLPLEGKREMLPLPGAEKGAPLPLYGKVKNTPEEQEKIIRHKAQEYETVLIAEMLDKAIPEGKEGMIFGGGQANSIFRSLMVEQYAKSMSQGGGVGLSEKLTQEILALSRR